MDHLKEKRMERELLDEDGENLAVRCFLLLYGGTLSHTVGRMRDHMEMSGFAGCWPEWVQQAFPTTHLTKGGAQSWLRHLFALEALSDADQIG
jgi:hypothetical protein